MCWEEIPALCEEILFGASSSTRVDSSVGVFCLVSGGVAVASSDSALMLVAGTADTSGSEWEHIKIGTSSTLTGTCVSIGLSTRFFSADGRLTLASLLAQPAFPVGMSILMNSGMMSGVS